MEEFDVIIWDFDGVILDSNDIRSLGFTEVLQSYPSSEVQKLLDYHMENGGLSRYHKFKYFFNNIRKESVTEEEIFQYAMKFKKIMLDSLCRPELLIEDSLSFIRKNNKNFTFHIASGSDEKELNEICRRLNIDHFFKTINGSPTPKKELVRSILSGAPEEKKHALIGDSINDYDAAHDNKIKFYAYNNHDLQSNHDYIKSFNPLQIIYV